MQLSHDYERPSAVCHECQTIMDWVGRERENGRDTYWCPECGALLRRAKNNGEWYLPKRIKNWGNTASDSVTASPADTSSAPAKALER